MPRSNTREKIQEYLAQRNVEGEPPTVREIASAVGLKSPSSVQKHLKALEREGVITQGGRGRSRSWRLSSIPTGGSTIPVVGRIEAGTPVDQVDDVGATLPISPSAFSDGGHVVAFRVADDTLVDQGILNGDYVLVARAPHRSRATHDGVGALLTWHRRRVRGDTNDSGDHSASNVDALEAPVAILRLPRLD